MSKGQNGNVTARHDYQPFGEEIQRASYGADTIRKHFTGYERDIESDLNFAKNRYHNYDLGRFTSPDPYKIVAEIKYEKDEEKAKAMLNRYISQTQQWNQYVYAINNPLKYTDPTGEEIWLRGTKKEIWEAFDLIGRHMLENSTGITTEYLEMKDGSIVLRVTMDEESAKALIAKGKGTDNEILFQGMAEMLSSTTVIEGRIDGNFINLKGEVTRVPSVVNPHGAEYIPRGWSSTGHGQAVISPHSVDLANAATERSKKLSSDGQPLTFTKAMIFAHELGHAWDSLRSRSYSDEGALGFENAMRARDKSNNRRRKAEQ